LLRAKRTASLSSPAILRAHAQQVEHLLLFDSLTLGGGFEPGHHRDALVLQPGVEDPQC